MLLDTSRQTSLLPQTSSETKRNNLVDASVNDNVTELDVSYYGMQRLPALVYIALGRKGLAGPRGYFGLDLGSQGGTFVPVLAATPKACPLRKR
jgi:hypothetical protein